MSTDIRTTMQSMLARIQDQKALRAKGSDAKDALSRNLQAKFDRDSATFFADLKAATIVEEFERDGALVVNRALSCQKIFDKWGGGDDVYASLYKGKKAHQWSIFTRGVLAFVKKKSPVMLKNACLTHKDEAGNPDPIPFDFDVSDKDVQQVAFEVVAERLQFGSVPTRVVATNSSSVVNADHPAVALLANLL